MTDPRESTDSILLRKLAILRINRDGWISDIARFVERLADARKKRDEVLNEIADTQAKLALMGVHFEDG